MTFLYFFINEYVNSEKSVLNIQLKVNHEYDH
jgi:hypothetical protein